MPETVPAAIEWSPPSTSGKWPRLMIRSTFRHATVDARAISAR